MYFPTPTVWGSNVTATSSALHPHIARNYDPVGQFPVWNLGRECLSFKLSPSGVVSGTFDDQLRAFCASVKTPKYLCYQHEPENPSKQLVPAQFCQAFRRVSEIVRSSGAPIRTVLTLMEYTLQPVAHRSWQSWFPGAQYVDVFGWDVYWPVLTDDTAARLNDCVAATAASGVQSIAFPEIGVQGGDPAKLADVVNKMAAVNPEFACYFDNSQWQISNNPAAVAAWRDNQ